MRVTGSAAALLCAGALVAGCGGNDDVVTEARPPQRILLTGVIKDDAVWLSSSRVGAGPVTITLANQTDTPRTITLEGETTREQVGPVAPADAGTIRRTLEPGIYDLSAGSNVAVPKEIAPARLTIGPERASSDDQLLLP